MSDYIITEGGELYHYGVKGMKWGKRKNPQQPGYKSTSIRSALARRSNDKVDKSFKEWHDNTQKRDNAIDLGKKTTAAKRAYDANKSDKSLKRDYVQTKKDYKKALRENTTYRKGVVKQEVGRDAARKYLSDAKKVKKQLENDPQNKQLQKQYNKLMSKHDIERAKARRATDVSTNRSLKKASIKRSMSMTVKSFAGTAAVAAGAYAVNQVLKRNNVTLNGKTLSVNADQIRKFTNIGKQFFDLIKYV